MIYYIVSLLVIILDQLTKWAIVKYMNLYDSIPLVEGWLHITSSRNRGAAFGILQNQRILFISLTVIVAILVIFYIHRIHKEHKLYAFSLALILGGAIGNLIDRIATGEVVDFVDVRIINFAIFNVADSAITIGVVLLVIDLLFFNKEEKKVK